MMYGEVTGSAAGKDQDVGTFSLLLLVLILSTLLLLLFPSYLFPLLWCSLSTSSKAFRGITDSPTEPFPLLWPFCSFLFLSILPFLHHAFPKVPQELLMVSAMFCGLFLVEATGIVCPAQDSLFSQETTLQPLPLLPNPAVHTLYGSGYQKLTLALESASYLLTENISLASCFFQDLKY